MQRLRLPSGGYQVIKFEFSNYHRFLQDQGSERNLSNKKNTRYKLTGPAAVVSL